MPPTKETTNQPTPIREINFHHLVTDATRIKNQDPLLFGYQDLQKGISQLEIVLQNPTDQTSLLVLPLGDQSFSQAYQQVSTLLSGE